MNTQKVLCLKTFPRSDIQEACHQRPCTDNKPNFGCNGETPPAKGMNIKYGSVFSMFKENLYIENVCDPYQYCPIEI